MVVSPRRADAQCRMALEPTGISSNKGDTEVSTALRLDTLNLSHPQTGIGEHSAPSDACRSISAKSLLTRWSLKEVGGRQETDPTRSGKRKSFRTVGFCRESREYSSRRLKGQDARLTFRRCGRFLRGVIDMMNEYREEFSLGVEGEEIKHSRCVPWNQQFTGQQAQSDVFPEIRAGVLLGGFSAVKYGRRKPPCCSTCYPILFMSEYSKTLRYSYTPCHPVIPDVSENTKPSVSLMHLLACLKDVKQHQNDRILEKDIF
ncbi:hypothetical protein ALC53_12031 [Atta colombica]|uniref:Uncharacterized protein n=1 Tax=Atta colombica TaxID=520822 RepID=A0A195AZR9_9HYME|nr:hypothetical protein ALC53_12031 [Atta colombica]